MYQLFQYIAFLSYTHDTSHIRVGIRQRTYVHTHTHAYTRRQTRCIYANFREIRVLYFRASLRPVDAKSAEEKSQVRIVFERSAGGEKRRGKRFGSLGEFLRSPYTTL